MVNELAFFVLFPVVSYPKPHLDRVQDQAGLLGHARFPSDDFPGEHIDGERRAPCQPTSTRTLKSATHSRFGAPAVNWRLTKSAARAPSGSGTVVRTFFLRTAPARPTARISHSARH